MIPQVRGRDEVPVAPARSLHPTPPMRLLFPAALIALSCACAVGNADPNADSVDPPTTVPTDTADPVLVDAKWFSVETGQLRLEDGIVQPNSAITISVWESTPEGQPHEFCSDTYVLDSAPSIAQPNDEVVLFGMWTISLDSGACSGRPEELELGIGPLLPDLWPSVSEEDFSIKQTRGLYVSNPERDGLWVFGLAGTSDQLAGVGAPPSLDALPDGTYLMRGYYLLPL